MSIQYSIRKHNLQGNEFYAAQTKTNATAKIEAIVDLIAAQGTPEKIIARKRVPIFFEHLDSATEAVNGTITSDKLVTGSLNDTTLKAA